MMPYTWFPVFIFFAGLFLGSFLNVILYRLWTHEQFLSGRSHCPHCRHPLSAKDLVPLVSFFLLQARCRYCHAPISPQYPLIEFATGALLALTAWHFGPGAAFLFAAVVTSFLIIIFTFDLFHRLILDVVSIPFALIGLATGLVLGRSVSSLLLGAGIGGGFFLLQILLSRGRWVGGGDAKFGVGMGFLLGWEHVLLALFLAYTSGAFFSAGLLLAKKAEPTSAVPFGVFLAPATYVALLWAEPILTFYDHLV